MLIPLLLAANVHKKYAQEARIIVPIVTAIEMITVLFFILFEFLSAFASSALTNKKLQINFT